MGGQPAATREQHSFEHVTCFACDDTGRLFGVSQRSRGGAGASEILVARIHQQLLAASSTQDAHAPTLDLSGADVAEVLRASPPIQFAVSSIVAASNGHQLLLIGAADEDADVPVVALVDVYGASPDTGYYSSDSSNGTAAARKTCALQYVHNSLHSNRPGLSILQTHALRLYHLNDLSEPEQSFHLRLHGSGQPSTSAVGIGVSGLSRSRVRPTAFAWGPAVGWGKLAVLVLASDGGVYSLCPVAPFGVLCSAGTLRGLLDTAQDSLQPKPGRAAAVAMALSSYEGRGVSGPRGGVARSSDRAQYSGRGGRGGSDDSDDEGSSVAGGGDGRGGGATGPPVHCSALLTAFRDGRVYAHALDDGAVRGAWVEGTPQCSYDHRGDIYAVRTECDLLPLESVAELDAEGYGYGQEGDSSGASSPLLLLDCVDLRLHTSSTGAPAQPGASSWMQSSYDDDEDEEEGEEVQQRQQGRQGQQVEGGDDGVHELLRRVQLHVCPDASGLFWAVHDRGAWGINVRWLPRVASLLATDGEAGSLREAGGTSDLPKPGLAEMLVSELGLVCSDAVASPLLGAGCVVLERGGRMLYLRPRPSGEVGDVLAQMQGLRVGDAAGAAGASGEAGGARLGAEMREEIEEELQQVYAEVWAGPRNLPLPKPAGKEPPGSDTPEGMARLHEAIAILNEKHVVYVHKAHYDLQKRMMDLQGEVLNHHEAVSDMGKLSQEVAERQQGIQARLARLRAIHTNLDERLRLLATLHWSLPRPASKAEQELARELEVWEDRLKELQLSWRAMSQRVQASVAHAKRAGGVRGAALGQLPAGQLPRIHDALGEQATRINDGLQKLALVTEELEVWREEHAAEVLPQQLAEMASGSLSAM